MAEISVPSPQLHSEAIDPRQWEDRPFYLYGVGPQFHAALLARLFFARSLPAVLMHKLRRRLLGPGKGFEPAVVYNQLVVFDQPLLDRGGLVYGPDFLRILLELGLARQGRVCEFACGAGYIGYWLLAHGFCEELTFVDINPAAVEAVMFTARMNRLEDRVHAYRSDALEQVPASERWDLVVVNPPKLQTATREEDPLIAMDVGWPLHRRFYQQVRSFLRPGGYVVMVEEGEAGEHDQVFRDMVQAGGGQWVRAVTKITAAGAADNCHYVVSRW